MTAQKTAAPTVKKVHFRDASGHFRGIGTRVTFHDLVVITFMGALGKAEAIKQASSQRERHPERYTVPARSR
jgi:hypothetical protein